MLYVLREQESNLHKHILSPGYEPGILPLDYPAMLSAEVEGLEPPSPEGPPVFKTGRLPIITYLQIKKFPTSVIEQLTQILKMFVQILTAFLFHSIHLVALPITMTSIACLPLQGLSTVNSVCPLSSQDSSSLNSNSPSETLCILLYQSRRFESTKFYFVVSICQRPC